MSPRRAHRAPVRMYGCPARSAITIMSMSQHSEPRSASASATSWTLGAAVIIIIGLLAAGVSLAAAGWKETSIIGLLTAVGTVAGGLLVLLPKLVQLQQTVEKVVDQTNGAMRKMVREEVRLAVTELLAEQDVRTVAREPATRTVTNPTTRRRGSR